MLNNEFINELLDTSSKWHKMLLEHRREEIAPGELIAELYVADIAEEIAFILRNSMFELKKLEKMSLDGYSPEDLEKFISEIKATWEEEGDIRSKYNSMTRRTLISALEGSFDDSGN